jgi:hypothetical protein
MTGSPEPEFDAAVEAFLDLLARLIARAHLRRSADPAGDNVVQRGFDANIASGLEGESAR